LFVGTTIIPNNLKNNGISPAMATASEQVQSENSTLAPQLDLSKNNSGSKSEQCGGAPNTCYSDVGENRSLGFDNIEFFYNESRGIIDKKNEVAIGYSDMMSPLEIKRILESSSNKVLEIHTATKWMVVYPQGNVTTFVNSVKNNSWVRYVEQNKQTFHGTSHVPNDLLWNSQWGPASINCPRAWDIEKGNTNIRIAIVDTGIDYTHPDIAAHYLPIGYDGVNSDNDPRDDMGHGTHCAGIAAAVIDNHVGIAGVSNVSIMAEKVLDQSGDGNGWFIDVANGIEHATNNGADIISMSLGDVTNYSVIYDACKYAWDNGVVLIASSGNDNERFVSYPAQYPIVIAVGAINSNNERCDESDWEVGHGSNYGPELDLVAPGNDILSLGMTNRYSECEGIYRDNDQNHVVSIGDTRLYYFIPGHPPGTTVSANDDDIGFPLVTFGPLERFNNTDGNGHFDRDDWLYLDNDNNQIVSVGDLRLLFIIDGYIHSGLYVQVGDFDIGMPLIGFPANENHAIYSFMSGTSMATPHVAGVAALILSHVPSLRQNNWAIKEVLYQYADDLGAPGWDEEYGYGRVDAYDAVAQPCLYYSIMCDWAGPECGDHGPPKTEFNVGDLCRSYSEICNTHQGDTITWEWKKDGVIQYTAYWTIPEPWESICCWSGYTVDEEGTWQVDIRYNTEYIGSGPEFIVIDSIYQWTTETVDGPNDLGDGGTSIDLDSQNNPHISYFDDTTNLVKYAYKTGSTWHTQFVDQSSHSQGPTTAIAIDSQNHPHIAYLHLSYSPRYHKYGHWTGSSWDIKNIEPAEGITYAYYSIALDSSDNPHIIYRDDNYNTVKYAYWNGASWDIQTIATGGSVDDRKMSLVLDSHDIPHMSFSLNRILYYAYWNESQSQWVIQEVDSRYCGDTSLALDNNGNPHICYCYNEYLKYAKFDGYEWEKDEIIYLGFYPSLALDSLDYPHISYYDADNLDLKFVYWNPYQGWKNQTIDSYGDVGEYTSLVLDENNNAYISYHDYDNADLKFAKGIRRNNPPYRPNTPYPLNNSIDIDVDDDLNWIGGDSDQGDTVTYDVYFCDSNPPIKIVSNQSSTVFNPGRTHPNRIYYWQIIAWDNHHTFTRGPVWQFSTVLDNTQPHWRNQNQNKTNILSGEPIELFAQGCDDHELNLAWLATNESGEWVNFIGGETTSDWWNPGWNYRKQITINHTKVTSDLTNFPVLVSTTSSDFINHAQADGDDFVFVDSTNSNRYNHEIETYINAIGALVAWVNVTRLSSTQDTVLYVYYGNPSCSNQQNKAGTWDNNYVYVLHMNDSTPSTVKDSTVHGYTGTKAGANEPLETTGKIAEAQSFDSANDNVDMGTKLIPKGAKTISCWIRVGTGTDLRGIVDQTDFSTMKYGSLFYIDSSHGLHFKVTRGLNNNPIFDCAKTGTYDNNQWYYVTATWDGTTSANTAKLYIDGIMAATATAAQTETVTPTYNDCVGNRAHTEDLGLNGLLDEYRVSNIQRNSSWISTEYNTMNSPSTFMTVGTEENRSSGEIPWWNTSWQYRKQITINHTKVPGNLTNFPVFISTTSPDFIIHAQSDGDDFIFISSDNLQKYNHEGISYNTITGTLVAWMNIPFLSSTKDTSLYIYYGNPTCEDQQHAEETWDSDFLAVYHCNDPSSGLKDSTSHHYDMTQYGNPTYGNAGKIYKSVFLPSHANPAQNYFERTVFNSTETQGYVEAWAKPYGSMRIFTPEDTQGGLNYHTTPFIWFNVPSAGHNRVAVHGVDSIYYGNTDLTAQTWNYVVWGANAATDTQFAYANSVKQTITQGGSTVKWWSDYSDLDVATIGCLHVGDTGLTEQAYGYLEEIRVSKSTRNDAWFATTYNSENSPSTFMTIGSEENQSGGIAYGSPLKMQENNEWQWSNFTWQNPTIPNGTRVSWKIYYRDTCGNTNCTDIMSFFIGEQPEIDPDRSFVTLTNENMPFLVTCPAHDGPVYQHVKVTCRDASGNTIPGIPASAFTFTLGNVNAIWYDTLSCTFAPVDTQTNANGEIRFTIKGDTSIYGNITIRVTVQGVPINDLDTLPCKSVDYDTNGVVSLGDFVIFARDYSKVRWRSDFTGDGLVSLGDFVLFAGHYAHHS
jgi:subtilisin family serine protease